MGIIKDKYGMHLTEAEVIKKRWQKYTEELYEKISLIRSHQSLSRVELFVTP